MRLKNSMKKSLFFLAGTFLLLSCETKINEAKIDSVGKKLQSTVERGADSVASKFGRLRDSLRRDARDTIIIDRR